MKIDLKIGTRVTVKRGSHAGSFTVGQNQSAAIFDNGWLIVNTAGYKEYYPASTIDNIKSI